MSVSEITEKKSVFSLICGSGFYVNSFNTIFKKGRSRWGLDK